MKVKMRKFGTERDYHGRLNITIESVDIETLSNEELLRVSSAKSKEEIAMLGLLRSRLETQSDNELRYLYMVSGAACGIFGHAGHGVLTSEMARRFY